jgi:hypothetical protein
MDPMEVLRLQQVLTGVLGSWLAGNQPHGLWSAAHPSSPAATPTSAETHRTGQESGANSR